MTEYATKQEVQTIVDKAVEDLSEIITGFAKQVDERFDKVETNIFKIEGRIDGVERHIIDLKASHDRLLNTIDKFVGRLDSIDIEDTARDSQFEKLLVWAREVSKKTGIPLRDL